jgi:Flp pilus assembly protein TadD
VWRGCGETGTDDLRRALELHRAGRLEDAAVAYLKLLEPSPNHPDLLRLLGLLRFQQGRGDEAVALLGQAVGLHPDFLDGRRALALVLGKIGRRDDALVQHAEAVSLASGNASAHNDFGCALLESGRLSDAAEVLRLAVDLDPEGADALTNLAATLNRMGRLDEASGLAGRAVALRPDHAGSLVLLSAVLASIGDYAGAERAARRAVRLQGADAGAWIQLSNILILGSRMQRPRSTERQWNWRPITGLRRITGSTLCTFRQPSAMMICSTLFGVGGRGNLGLVNVPTEAAIRKGGCGSGMFRLTSVGIPLAGSWRRCCRTKIVGRWMWSAIPIARSRMT